MNTMPAAMLPPSLIQLRNTLGPAAVLFGDDVPARNCNDWSTQPPNTPIAVVRPRDAAGVSAALRACREAGIPVVPQGGLTGLVGAAVAGVGLATMGITNSREKPLIR